MSQESKDSAIALNYWISHWIGLYCTHWLSRVFASGVPAAVVSTARTYWVTRVLCSPRAYTCAFKLALTGKPGRLLLRAVTVATT